MCVITYHSKTGKKPPVNPLWKDFLDGAESTPEMLGFLIATMSLTMLTTVDAVRKRLKEQDRRIEEQRKELETWKKKFEESEKQKKVCCLGFH